MVKKVDSEEQENRSETEQQEPAVLDDVASLQEALAEERATAEKHLAGWQRAQADLVNYKKHAEQERLEGIRFANTALILNLLLVIDDFERAFASLPPELADSTWVEGVRLVQRKLWASLEGQGLSEIAALGEPFDPTLHEAVMQVEGEEGKVVEELQRGYKLHERVIRPARVAVGRGKGEEKEG